jgi:hypothetical protein
MKRIVLMAVVSAGLLVPGLALVSNAGAANPHGDSPGQGGADPDASCGGSSGAKPPSCHSENLPFSEGCEHGQAPVQNPHCNPGDNVTTTPTTPTTPSTPTSGAPAGGTAGETGAGGSQGASQGEGPGAAGAAQGGNAAGQLAFTGLDALWLALLGAGLLGSGLALRARYGSSA